MHNAERLTRNAECLKHNAECFLFRAGRSYSYTSFIYFHSTIIKSFGR